MHTKFLASSLVAFCLSATAAAAATDFPKAPVTTNNNPTVQLKAELLDKSNSTIRGKLTAFALPHGIGVKVNARFTGLPDGEPLSASHPFSLSPSFSYHSLVSKSSLPTRKSQYTNKAIK